MVNVLLGEADALQRADEEVVRVGAARRRDALALQILDLGDAGIGPRH